MNALEQAARERWVRWGSWAKWTICRECNEWRYCRSKAGRRPLCLECFDQD